MVLRHRSRHVNTPYAGISSAVAARISAAAEAQAASEEAAARAVAHRAREEYDEARLQSDRFEHAVWERAEQFAQHQAQSLHNQTVMQAQEFHDRVMQEQAELYTASQIELEYQAHEQAVRMSESAARAGSELLWQREQDLSSMREEMQLFQTELHRSARESVHQAITQETAVKRQAASEAVQRQAAEARARTDYAETVASQSIANIESQLHHELALERQRHHNEVSSMHLQMTQMMSMMQSMRESEAQRAAQEAARMAAFTRMQRAPPVPVFAASIAMPQGPRPGQPRASSPGGSASAAPAPPPFVAPIGAGRTLGGQINVVPPFALPRKAVQPAAAQRRGVQDPAGAAAGGGAVGTAQSAPGGSGAVGTAQPLAVGVPVHATPQSVSERFQRRMAELQIEQDEELAAALQLSELAQQDPYQESEAYALMHEQSESQTHGHAASNVGVPPMMGAAPSHLGALPMRAPVVSHAGAPHAGGVPMSSTGATSLMPSQVGDTVRAREAPPLEPKPTVQEKKKTKKSRGRRRRRSASSGSSSSSVRYSRAPIALPQLPAITGFRAWRGAVRDIAVAAAGKGESAMRWIKEVESEGATIAKLADSGTFLTIDLKLKAAISIVSTKSRRRPSPRQNMGEY